MSVLGRFLRVAGGADAYCAGTKCRVCERLFGCLTEAWGKCCVQFFQLNGKRSLLADRKAVRAKRDENRLNKRRTLFGQPLTSSLLTTRDQVGLMLTFLPYVACKHTT